MAKTMAIIKSGKVENLRWCSDSTEETDTLKDTEDRDIQIGDAYNAGKWYRDGIEILTPLEAANQEISQLKAEKAELEMSYRKGVNSI